MRQNFTSSLAGVLLHEGGYCDDPRDPGGATNKGITQAVYDDWRQDHLLGKQSVRLVSAAEAAAIYMTRYWYPIRGDELPSGVDYCTFDFAVNSGRDRAARFLQRSLDVIEDGHIGPVTLAAAKEADPEALVDQVCNLRLGFLQALPTFDHFGKGWTARVEDVRAKAKAMA